MKIAVIGTGYVGLVSGTCFAEIGHEVICMDIDKQKIAKLNNGEIPIYEPGLAGLVAKNSAEGRLKFTDTLSQIGKPEAIFFALPTPPGGDGSADLKFILSAAEDVSKVLTKYTVIVDKSTVPVGTSKKVSNAIKKNTKAEFDVVSNPEFLREGTAIDDFLNADRIVIGSTSKKALKVMEEIYRPLTTSGVPMIEMDEASAELTKYAANSFLATKISYMNEIANLCELVGANVDLVREGIGADERINKRFLSAGIGYGGSCFPKDVLALQKVASDNDCELKIVNAVLDSNSRQKRILLQKIAAFYNGNIKGKKFAVWGLAFKPDTDDIREAPSLEIINGLLEMGATVRAFDPEAVDNAKKLLGDKISYAKNATEALEGSDALIIATEWKEFTSFEVEVIAKKLNDKAIFDGRNIFDHKTTKKHGLKHFSIGRS